MLALDRSPQPETLSRRDPDGGSIKVGGRVLEGKAVESLSRLFKEERPFATFQERMSACHLPSPTAAPRQTFGRLRRSCVGAIVSLIAGLEIRPGSFVLMSPGAGTSTPAAPRLTSASSTKVGEAFVDGLLSFGTSARSASERARAVTGGERTATPTTAACGKHRFGGGSPNNRRTI